MRGPGRGVPEPESSLPRTRIEGVAPASAAAEASPAGARGAGAVQVAAGGLAPHDVGEAASMDQPHGLGDSSKWV